MNAWSLADMFSHAFVVRALIVGVLVSLCASLLGVILVLKRYSMIGHGLAEVGFASMSLALALGFSPLYFSAPVLVVASFVIMSASQKYGVSGDLAVGVASTGALAFGIIVTSMSGGFNIDVYNYMFGSVLAMNNADVAVSAIVSLLVIGTYALFYNRLCLIASDEDFARSQGWELSRYHFLISLLVAMTITVGMRMMGTLLISSLIVMPTVTARKLAPNFKTLVIASGAVSVAAFLIGLILSFLLNLPTGASVVASNIALLCLAECVRRIRAI